MMKVRIWFHKITVFFSAIFLMNVLFLFKGIYALCTNESCQNKTIHTISMLVSLIGIGLGVLGLIAIFKKPQNDSKRCKVEKIKNETGTIYFGYFPLFVMSFVNYNIDDAWYLINTIILILVLAIVYCQNNLFYINPTILLLGKRIYILQVTYNNTIKEIKVITSEKIELNEEYNFSYSEYDFTFCAKN